MGKAVGVQVAGVLGSRVTPSCGMALTVGICLFRARLPRLAWSPRPRRNSRRVMLLGIGAGGGKGKLVLDDQGCIRVNSDAGYLLLWPEDFSVRGTGNSVQILDGQERVVARIGDQVEMSGGAVDTHEWPHSKTVRDLPAECKGPYWMVGKFG